METLASSGIPRRSGDGLHDAAGDALHVVLVDDNMHFRSMRHEVLRLARDRKFSRPPPPPPRPNHVLKNDSKHLKTCAHMIGH